MGFNSFYNSTPNPAQRFYNWSGGMKEITLPDGSTAKQPKGELRYKEGGEKISVPLPMKFCVLEETHSITGYEGQGTGVTYFSNEITTFKDEKLVVKRKEDGAGTTVVWKNYYNKHTKETLPGGAKFQTNLYIYNPVEQRVERINAVGSFLSAWIEFTDKHKGAIYEHVISVEPGEKKSNGAVDYIVPKFTLCEKYEDGDMKILVEQDKIVTDFLKVKREANLKDAEASADSYDQTPAEYDGEGSQEVQIDDQSGPTASQEAQEGASDGQIDLSDIPF